MNLESLKFKKIDYIACICLLALSFLLVLFNTSMSPLYDPSYITHDASVFYVMGRGMKEGLVPYKDLFDHKGLYIYLFYYLAALIGEKNQMGLYILSSILVFLFSLTIYKIVRLYKDSLISFFTALGIEILSTSMFFCHNSMLCEYIALFTISISIYFMAKHFVVDKGVGFSPIVMLINGILFSINLFNKANYCLYFAVVAIYVFVELVFINKDIKKLIYNVIFGILGVIIGAAPVIIYCLVNDCISDMYFAVFTFNFSYVEDLSIDLPKEVDTKFKALIYTLRSYTSTYILCIGSILILCYKKYEKKLILFFTAAFITLALAATMALTAYSHYMSLMIPFLIPIVTLFVEGLINAFAKPVENKKILKYTSLFFILIGFALTSKIIGRDILLLNFSYSSNDSKKVKNAISRYVSLNKKSNVLCVGLGTYYYNYLGVLPKVKHFYIPGISYEKFPHGADEIIKYINSEKADVILYFFNKEYIKIYGDRIENLINSRYQKIDVGSKDNRIYIKRAIYNSRISEDDEDEE